MNKQAVKIGVDRLFLAKLTKDDVTGVTYDTAFAVPGVTEIGLTVNNSTEVFYADDGAYDAYQQQGEVEASISLAGLSAEVLSQVTGSTYSVTNGLIKDNKSDSPDEYAVGFRTQKSNGEYQYCWLLKGKFSKPNQTATTKSGSATPQPEQYSYKALMRVYDGDWRHRVNSDDENLPTNVNKTTLDDVASGWWSTPDFVPVAIS